MLDSLLQFDQWLFLLLNGAHADWLDFPMWLFSTRWFWIPVYVYLLFTLYRRYGIRRFGWIVGIIALSVLINDQLASSVFKEWIGRPRPTYTDGLKDFVHTVVAPNGQEYRGGRFGFYSSHAANLFGVAILYFFLMRPMKRWAIGLLFGWVTLIGYSRIYLGVHFPSDILMGAAMGSAIGAFCYYILLWFSPVNKAIA